LETAGGVLSPGPSGTVQADLYRPLRLPVLLIGDSKLGGISSTVSAFESLHLRGYDVDSVVLFEDPKWGNYSYLSNHFLQHGIESFALPMPPPKQASSKDDESAMLEYYWSTSLLPAVNALLDRIHEKHHKRKAKLASMSALGESVIWHPFRQHGLPQEIIAIDSAYGDQFQAHTSHANSENSPLSAMSALSPMSKLSESKPLLTPLFDGSASWWTQGLGHGNPTLSLTAAHAAGRYGHVMFANAVHGPALDLSYSLLSSLANPRLSRVFYTDNGSTGMEVAVKMGLRASCARHGWDKQKDTIEVLGLAGSYHGDTIGVMNCSEPSPFNEKVDWYKPSGFWFNPPQLKMRQGVWEVILPRDLTAGIADDQGSSSQGQAFYFNNLADVFDFRMRKDAGHEQHYAQLIQTALTRLIQDHGRKFGALILEPIVMGAGGMIFVDPLFQRTLIQQVRCLNVADGFFFPKQPTNDHMSPDWTGIPIIADEVFTGLYRLGRPSSSSFLSADPASGTLDVDIAADISVHAKLLTGGLLPLAITTASESIFNAFLSDKKQDALLHGHSYTAHAVGCAVANKSLEELGSMDKNGRWEEYKKSWALSLSTSSMSSQTPSSGPSNPSPSACWSFWSPDTLKRLSHSTRVSGVWALGTVLAITLRSDASTSGYTSNAAATLQQQLLTLRDEDDAGIHSRVLGDVLYLMTSLTMREDAVRRIEGILVKALC
jgi:dethiobiotin synthetase/adenosylmethionine--8-amino-7-oxononanoate aminotransferase